ncbi:PREDICTED: solute carrier family 12 member 9-like [Amphimedon queenslandica]|uniref:Solute carrier family 12 member 9 n=1 Tax=Amphimedon queenslandica TaxID=400682 RepID=A0A1X7VHJ0_AMPQE|nr:PREDICTED: solute carrier family 12 member 9-like [Amphimedon queenslandica]|eukprot:XP_019848754.1 PREDICTED: solute carrier family 12 member 9-like [Amphimedon queenslandica]
MASFSTPPPCSSPSPPPPSLPLAKGQDQPVRGVKISFSVMEGSGQTSKDEISIDGLPQDEGVPLLQKKVTQKYEARKKKLGMIFGVTIPCILSIFSVVLFLRLGMVVGQAGFLETIVMLLIGYSVVVLTVLSISAIATNGNVEGGGVYFMISRALGPEFGGSIGAIFVIANIFGSATYIIGFVEALVSNFGDGSLFYPENYTLTHPVLPESYGYKLLYGSIILLFCLIVCLVGAGLFAKTTFIIFILVMTSIISCLVSFGYMMGPFPVPIAPDNTLKDSDVSFNYTGFSFGTFTDNFFSHYEKDYTQMKKLSFQLVFAILFNGCTGIMAGANISGELKSPSTAIPQGTLLACGITFCIYVVLFTLTAFTCEYEMLINNYNYLQYINIRPWLITVGVFAATLSAALSNLIGASRVLYALAKDRLFSGILHPFTWTVGKKKEPIVSVLLCWFLVQCTLFIGKLNAIAPIVTMFFLLSYGVVNLACLALKFASAPNFRPTFQFYSRYTSFLGALSCFVLMFVIQPLYAAITLVIMILLFVILLLRSPATPWGDVSQALIYHQVRKYLLRLDIRKSHVKFWRPEILLMVTNPRSSFRMIKFCNDLKKGGLYVLGHVVVQPFNPEVADYYNKQLKTWLDFVEISKFKAFVELTVSDTFRAGTRSLLTAAGLGGMKPNILGLGFYSKEVPQSCLTDLKEQVEKRSKFVRVMIRDTTLNKYDDINRDLPPLRQTEDDQILSQMEYVGVVQDAMTMGKNICILRHFEQFDNKPKAHPYIDVWPLCVRFNEEFENTFTLMMQLACVLHMKDSWKSSTKIRIFVVTETSSDGVMERTVMYDFLKDARIDAEVIIISQPVGISMSDSINTFTESFTSAARLGRGVAYYRNINGLMMENSLNASVIFTALPVPPEDINKAKDYINELSVLSNNLPPTVMVHGSMPVITNSI